MSYFFQKKLNKNQIKYDIRRYTLRKLFEQSNELALKVSEQNAPYMRNNLSNELRAYVKIEMIPNDEIISILDKISENNRITMDIIKLINNIILYFDLNIIPIYGFINYRNKLKDILKRYAEEYNKNFDNNDKLLNSLSNNNRINIKEVNDINKYENNVSIIIDELLFYLSNLNIDIQNEICFDIYNSKVNRIEDSRYNNLEIKVETPSVIDI